VDLLGLRAAALERRLRLCDVHDSHCSLQWPALAGWLPAWRITHRFGGRAARELEFQSARTQAQFEKHLIVPQR
jgi:hypothetical protein